eukprot:CAMPEP_0172529404 /NCGR_PEP_ID=MMETSP1067-20121228/3489_1 /TAXON_ID=265564 ORGANISM="Thalassiosira punctigera, Strain Tpunct2005C2" /NCGR_SAMPLE_ID=MMETSP1067 /ASSEMBLY_ACC=CAM_ASM_000444 /LENGTH=209 /DNA_ID=CAMNT_0013313447 /DNA_START=54 /DNA_END=683 /DNA_ORIENTATION=-
MPLSVAERKRRSRANNPELYTDEKAKSRERMSIYRGKLKSQKKARDFKGLLNDGEKRELVAKSAAHKRSLLHSWLASRDIKIPPDAIVDKKINLFVSKIEMHKIDREVAEYEVSLSQDLLCARAGSCGGGGGTTAEGKSPPPPTPEVVPSSIVPKNQSLNNCRPAGINTDGDEKSRAGTHQDALDALLFAAQRMESGGEKPAPVKSECI